MNNKTSLLLSCEDIALFAEDKCASKKYNLKRKLLADKLLEAFKMVMSQAPTAKSLQETTPVSPEQVNVAVSDSYPTVWNNNRVDHITSYAFAPGGFAAPISQTSILEKAPPQDRRANIFLRADTNGLTCGIRIPRAATYCIRNLEKLSRDGDYVAKEKIDDCVRSLQRTLEQSPDQSSRHAAMPLVFVSEHTGFDLRKQPAPESLEALVAVLHDQKQPPPTAWGWVVQHPADAASASDASSSTPSNASSSNDDSPHVSTPDVSPHDAWLDGVFAQHFQTWMAALSQLSWTSNSNHLRSEIEEKKKATQVTLKKGAKVRVIDGLFTGKVGRIERIDANDTVRVEIGRIPISLSRAAIIVLQ